MNIVSAQNTGECSLHRTWTVWTSFTILFARDSLFADLIWSWEITGLAGVSLRSHWVTSSVCTGNVLWNDSGTQNNSHFRIYLSFMTQTAAPLFRRPCDKDSMCWWKVSCCYSTTNRGWWNHQWHHTFTYLSVAINPNFSCPENGIIIAVYSGLETLKSSVGYLSYNVAQGLTILKWTLYLLLNLIYPKPLFNFSFW